MQAETWKLLESHKNDLLTFPHTCMLAVLELVGRLGECAAQQTVSWGKLWNTLSPQSWRLPRQGWSCHGLLMSAVPMLLGKESFPIHSLLSPNPILKYVMRQHCIYNRVDSISLHYILLHFFQENSYSIVLLSIFVILMASIIRQACCVGCRRRPFPIQHHH